MSFKVGDKVVCIDNLGVTHLLDRDGVYTVCSVTMNGNVGIDLVNPGLRVFKSERFKPLEDEPLKPGDLVRVKKDFYPLQVGEAYTVQTIYKQEDGSYKVKLQNNPYLYKASRFHIIDKNNPNYEEFYRDDFGTLLKKNKSGEIFWSNGLDWVPVDQLIWARAPVGKIDYSKPPPWDREGALFYHSGQGRRGIVRGGEWSLLRPYDYKNKKTRNGWGPLEDGPWMYHDKSGKWYREGIDPVPKVPYKFTDFGLNFATYQSCCGMMILYGFRNNPEKGKREEIIKDLRDEMFTRYGGKGTGMVQAVLNPTQHPHWDEILIGIGFKLLSKHPNYVHGPNHYNWLYAWVCEEHKTPVKEEKRAFG